MKTSLLFESEALVESVNRNLLYRTDDERVHLVVPFFMLLSELDAQALRSVWIFKERRLSFEVLFGKDLDFPSRLENYSRQFTISNLSFWHACVATNTTVDGAISATHVLAQFHGSLIWDLVNDKRANLIVGKEGPQVEGLLLLLVPEDPSGSREVSFVKNFNVIPFWRVDAGNAVVSRIQSGGLPVAIVAVIHDDWILFTRIVRAKLKGRTTRGVGVGICLY
jgi:hypothetical protein